MQAAPNFTGSAIDYINWTIKFHLADYFYIALAFALLNLIILIFYRGKLLYIFPVCFYLVSLVLVVIVILRKANFDWDYMLLLTFINFAVGYILQVIISIVISRPKI